MERLTWIAVFALTLADLRPRVSIRTLQAIGDECYSPTDEDPKGAAHAYHQARTNLPIESQFGTTGLGDL